MKQVAGHDVVAGDVVDAVDVVGVDVVAYVAAAAAARSPPGLDSNPHNSHMQSPIEGTLNNHANTVGNVLHD